jgi:hypothetical protein
MDMPPAGGSPSPNQLGPHPEDDRVRVQTLKVLGKCFLIFLMIPGIRLLIDRRDEPTYSLIVGTAITMPGVCVLCLTLYSVYKRLRENHRLDRGRCVHCGYAIAGLTTMKCPECGRDPIV